MTLTSFAKGPFGDDHTASGRRSALGKRPTEVQHEGPNKSLR